MAEKPDIKKLVSQFKEATKKKEEKKAK